MSDVIDDANDSFQQDLDRRIAAARGVVATKPEPLPEFCLNDCGAVPIPGGRYCCHDCRDEAAFRARQLKRAGVR